MKKKYMVAWDFLVTYWYEVEAEDGMKVVADAFEKKYKDNTELVMDIAKKYGEGNPVDGLVKWMKEKQSRWEKKSLVQEPQLIHF